MEKLDVDLSTLLEVIDYNLGSNIDSIYSQAIQLNNSKDLEKEDDLKKQLLWKTIDLKKQINGNLKMVVKNIIHQMRMINPNNIYMIKTIQRLEKAIK